MEIASTQLALKTCIYMMYLFSDEISLEQTRNRDTGIQFNLRPCKSSQVDDFYFF